MKRLVTLLLALTLLVSAFMLPEAAVAEDEKIVTITPAAVSGPTDPYMAPRTAYRCNVTYKVQFKWGTKSKATYVRVWAKNKSNFTITKLKVVSKCYKTSKWTKKIGTKTVVWKKTLKKGKSGYTSWKKLYKGMNSVTWWFYVYGARRWW